MSSAASPSGDSSPPLEAVCFLEALDAAGASFTFQTFDDSKAKRVDLAWRRHGTLEQQAATLQRANEQGAGVFVTVNETDGSGRKAKNITRVRALFVDLDGSPLQPVLDAAVHPNVVIESSQGRWHAYWLVQDCPLEDFKRCQQRLAARFAGDKSVNDLPRVMRLPGYIHQKGQPFRSRIEQLNDAKPYPYAELVSAFELNAPEAAPPILAPAPSPMPASTAGDVQDDLRDALRAIGAEEYGDWIRVGHALKTLGNDGLALWFEWSATSAKFNPVDAAKRWEGFHPDSTGYQAVFAEAKRHGWDPRRAPSVERKRAERAAHSPPPAAPPPAPGEDDPTAGETPPPENDAPPPVAVAFTAELLLRRFELVVGKTDVWDCDADAAMKWSAFTALVGEELAKAWKADPGKRGRIVKAPKKTPAAKRGKPTDPTRLEELIDRYALVYGTEAVFDFEYRMELTLGSLRAFAGLKAVRDWTDHPRRRVVRLEEVVFDPARDPSDRTVCNLWSGWPHLPVQGAGRDAELLQRWLAVLHYVCGESEAIFDWALKWFAYPLQHPGAKMRTSIILHGPEGSGKNTIFDAVRRIYGKYGTSITQVQLESQWTDWISAKLFVVGNEVLHRQEQITQKGRLKNLITEPTVPVDRKFLPGRIEPNFANMGFLSNELVPLNLDFKDRRFLVIWTPPPHPDGRAFYEGLSETEMPLSTVQALYQYLLDVDLGDFGPHSKPPMTSAKQELIEASMPSHERFLRAWIEGHLEVPFRPCKTGQLYQAYQHWCKENGERFPRPENAFGSFASKLVPRSNGPKRFFSGTATTEAQARCYLPAYPSGPANDPRAESTRLGESIDFFQKALNQWRNPQ